MGVVAYYHDDAGAPALTGEVGSLVNLLKKCLVDGYGAKPALGWEGLYSANYQKAAFRSTDVTGTRFWVHVDDSGPSAGGARHARMRGYESLAGLDGSGAPASPGAAFPTVAQVANLAVYKSFTLSNLARAWALVGDERLFYLFSYPRDNESGHELHGIAIAYGDYVTVGADQAYAAAIVGTSSDGTATPTWTASYTSFYSYQGHNTQQNEHYLARDWDVLGGAVKFGKIAALGANLNTGAGGFAYPNGPDNALLVAPAPMIATNGVSLALRGQLPGIYPVLQTRPVAHRAMVANVGGLPGRTLVFLNLAHTTTSGIASTGPIAVDVTGPWR